MTSFPNLRMRRLRQHPQLRKMLQQTRLSSNDFVLPLFIKEGHNIKEPIASMPGHFRWSVDQLDVEIQEIVNLKIPAVILFGIPNHKDANGSASWQKQGVVQSAIRKIKQQAPELLVIVDLCFCEYTDHGHCGVVEKNIRGHVDVHNDKTLELLVKQAVSLAEAGADIVAPSGMIDGMVKAIRQGLDQNGYQDIPILSYAVKYVSAFYGPFREAAESISHDRTSYQMDPCNSQQALAEAELDIQEGADLLMVKPAHSYLDIIYQIKHNFSNKPLVAYQVSGEFAMIKAAAERHWIDGDKAMMESLVAIKRAGADFIISYFAKEAIKLLSKNPS